MNKELFEINKKFLYNPKYFKGKINKKNIEKCRKDSLIFSEDIFVSLDNNFVDKNLNTFVLGSAGSGKSRYFVRPNILQANSSLVIYDYNGFLLSEHGEFLISKGYKLKYINFKDVSMSMKYNPFNYIHYDKDIYDIVDCIIENTKGMNDNDEIFYLSEKTLLSTFIFYIYVNNKKEDQNLINLLDIIYSCDLYEDNPFKNLDMSFYELLEEAISYREAQGFKNICSNKIIEDVLKSLLLRFSIFDKDFIKNLTSFDELELDELGKEKIALFIISSPYKDNYKSIISIFINQIINLIIKDDNLDEKQIHTRLILDDFECIGKLPKFYDKLYKMKENNASINIFIQSLNQLKNLYKNNWEKILENCDFLILAGTNNVEDIKYFNDFLSFLKISDSLSLSKPETLYLKGSNVKKIIKVKKFLLKSKDIKKLQTSSSEMINYLRMMKLNECLLIIRGFDCFLTRKYDLKQHPNYKTCGESSGNYFSLD